MFSNLNFKKCIIENVRKILFWNFLGKIVLSFKLKIFCQLGF